MNESDRKILARACDPHGYGTSAIASLLGCRSKALPCFTTPADWEMVRVEVVVPNFNEFVAYVWNGQVDSMGGVHDAFAYWLTLSPEDRCQLALDFMRENHIGDEFMEGE